MSSLVYHGPAARWLECLPLGDGRLGVMCDGGVPEAVFHLNDTTGWSGGPRSEARQPHPDPAQARAVLESARASIAAGDAGGAATAVTALQSDYTQAFLPIATLTVARPDATPGASTRSLDLRTGVHRVESAHGVDVSFVAAEPGVLVHLVEQATADPVVAIRSPLHELGRELRGRDLVVRLRFPSDIAPGHEPDLPAATWSDAPGDSLDAVVVVRIIPADARRRAVVLTTTATTFPGLGVPITAAAAEAEAEAVARLDRAEASGADVLFDAHVAEHATRMDRVRLEIDGPAGIEGAAGIAPTTAERLARAQGDPQGVLAADPGLAAVLFEYGRYLLQAASRPGGLPANLQGIWNDSMRPPWSSNYTVNINTEMNYWPAFVADLPETAEPLTAFILALAEHSRATTEAVLGAPGWTVHHNTDAWLFGSAPGRRRGDPRWAFWPLGGAWLARHLWEPVAFGQAGDAHLERVWPALRGAAEFGLHWLRPDADGRWTTSPSASPENAYLDVDGAPAALVAGSAMDLSLLRDLFGIVAATADRLGRTHDPVAVEAARRHAELPQAPAITADGRIREWDVDRIAEDPRHRHVSHLYGLFPGPGDWDAAHRDAAAATLGDRGDDSSGWALAWRVALWARLGRGDKVSDVLQQMFRDADAATGEWAAGLYPNLFAAQPPFQIDANLGYVAGVAEALLQSHADGIDLLPALPGELATGSVTGLVARPGITVDIRWRDGRLERAALRARTTAAAGEHRIRHRGVEIRRVIAATAATVVEIEQFEGVGERR